MFKKILIANRGEIACRIIKTARRMGIQTVAVYSEADANARHVRLADEAVLIGAAPAAESYLVIDRILAAATQTGAEAIHPGYGFLAENEQFAEACLARKLVFIGPPVEAIRAMGSKSEAKKRMEAAGVPLTPGYHGDRQEPEWLQEQADRIGYPLLIKASAGGGGKGMRIVEKTADFQEALASCKREALSSFGSDHVLLEQYLLRPRHIEIQVFGDRHGNYVHLFERDCSVQRRHQKVLEEAPAPGMSAERRAEMGKAATDAARAVGYEGAGTVEFIARQDGTFYFMEMNTRLQVEHPVTEMITGLDLVEWQLRVAAGQPLPLAQEQLQITGHALEARIYAEDPAKGFLPSTGRLIHLATPRESIHVRVDTGVEEGDEITPWYDPMIAKLIVWDQDREQALARLRQALAEYRIVGVANNVEFLSRLAACPAFASADLDTGLIEREQGYLFRPPPEPGREIYMQLALAELLREQAQAARETQEARHHTDPGSPWHARDGWRLNAAALRRLIFRHGEHPTELSVAYQEQGFAIDLNGVTSLVSGTLDAQGNLRAEIDGLRTSATLVASHGRRHLFSRGHTWVFARIDPLHVNSDASGTEGGLLAPMPGKVIALLAASSTVVEAGSPLLIIEAMKMEHTITAPSRGLVKAFHFEIGDQVSEGVELVDFAPIFAPDCAPDSAPVIAP